MSDSKTLTLIPAFVLHTRAYRDSSLLVELFTEQVGKISAVARGARRQRSIYKGRLQAFLPVLVSCSGKGELLTMTHIEERTSAYRLLSHTLLSGLYLNELLMRLLIHFDPYPRLFIHYENCIKQLAQNPDKQEVALRIFEKKLLKELGYALSLEKDLTTGLQIQDDRYYYYYPEEGVRVCAEERKVSYLGKHLLAIAEDEFDEPEVLSTAKRLMRSVLQHLLGRHTLHSRHLFRQLRQLTGNTYET